MAQEVKEFEQPHLTKVSGRSVKLFNSPSRYSSRKSTWANNVVAEFGEVSPGFDLAVKLAVYQGLPNGAPKNYPFGHGRFLSDELVAKALPFIPTVGVELEVPSTLESLSKYRLDLYRGLKDLGLQSHFEGGKFWEFSLPPSYSWRTQALLIHYLLDLNYIPYYSSKKQPHSAKRFVATPELYSLHCNLGVPADIGYSTVAQHNEMEHEAQLLAVACGIAYSTPARLKAKKSPMWSDITKYNEKTEKSPARDHKGRIELKAQGFGGISSYKQLAAAQELGAAFFAYLLPFNNSLLDRLLGVFKNPTQHVQLHDIWAKGREELLHLFLHKYGVLGYSIIHELKPSSNNAGIADIVEETDIKTKTRELLLSMRQQIHQVI